MNSTIEWVPRNVEPSVAKWMVTPCAVVLVRGHRRIGKSSTVEKVASSLHISPIKVLIDVNDDNMVDHFQRHFAPYYPVQSIYDIGMSIVHAIQQGKIVILEEIQNASPSLQVSLQQGIDYMAQRSMLQADAWKNSGMTFLMGSVQGAVDTMIENRRNPLYERITAKISVLHCDSSEMTHYFKRNGLFDKPSLMLFLHATFRGRLHSYAVAQKAGLLNPDNVDRDKIVKEVFASELQTEFFDSNLFCKGRYGSDVARALKAVLREKNKGNQVKAVQNALHFTPDEAFAYLDGVLFKRYRLIEPVYSLHKLKSNLCIERYVVLDPMLELAESVEFETLILREDVIRSTNHNFLDILNSFEGFHFERWVRDIIEDRVMLAAAPPVPGIFGEAEPCRCMPKIDFDIPDHSVEIDIIVGFPKSNSILFGSCKRNSEKTDLRGLRDHVETLIRSGRGMYYEKIISHLKLKKDNLRVVHAHFVVTEASDTILSHIQQFPNTYIISLQSLLDCFPVQWTDYTTMYQYKGGQTSGSQSEAEPSVSEPVHPPRNQSIYQRLHIIAESLGFEDVSRKGVPIPSYINDILKSIDDQELREVCGKRMSLSAKIEKIEKYLGIGV